MFKQISDNVYIRVSNSFDSNIIFINGGVKQILIDAGTGMNPDALNRDLVKIGSSVEALTDIVLTHSHIDHIGGVLPIIADYSPTLHLHRSEGDMINSGDMRLTLSTTFGVELPPMKIESLLEEGQDLCLGDVCLKVYSTPGHSIGSICLHIEDQGILITGDTLFPGGSFGRVDFPTGDPNQLVESLRRITEWEFVIALPGHMGAITSNAKHHAESSFAMASRMFRYQ
ncbi:MAG: MBL fold metallo-hydrolase [Candidatus Thorarchaeota archaeon]|jgi:glyoxylase-like metal-dependent hydrolase (beta-lactamase superfamily II)